MKPNPELHFLAPEHLQQHWNLSRTSLWRMEKAGLLTPFFLFTRKLYRVEEVSRLEGMIERGELRSALRGAARQGQKD